MPEGNDERQDLDCEEQATKDLQHWNVRLQGLPAPPPDSNCKSIGGEEHITDPEYLWRWIKHADMFSQCIHGGKDARDGEH